MRKFSLTKMVSAILMLSAGIVAQAQTYSNVNVSIDPTGVLAQGTDGNFYGTTQFQGSNNSGSIFKVTSGGVLKTLYSFCSLTNCRDGSGPLAGVVQGTNGNFYGTTAYGGASTFNDGTIFELTPVGKLTTLYSFCLQTNCPDGSNPIAPLVQGPNGNLYGVTYKTIFQITTAGKFTILHTFCSEINCADGTGPVGGLVLASNGKFYGTTSGGGANNNGTVFELTIAGKLTTIYNFSTCSTSSCPDGEFPSALTQASDGSFYGSTQMGGANTNYLCTLGKGSNDTCGTLFQVTANGEFKVIYNLCSLTNCIDGAYVLAGLAAGTDGNLYGVSALGGANLCGFNPQLGCGSVFRVTPEGNLTTLYSFCSGTACIGGSPSYPLLQATNGEFYGSAGDVVFSEDVSLAPFVEPRPTLGRVGAKVIILGNDLTGTSSVTFNGTAATFKVVSGTEISVIVPEGATTGTLEVTTSGRTLKSNVPFHVTP